jgi:hypothetical protein
MSKKENNTCDSCGYSFRTSDCEICEKIITDRCIDCHNEIKHDIIKNQNIHIVSSGRSPIDPDAHKISDQEYPI